MTTSTRRDPELLEIPDRRCLVVDGAGDPNGSEAFEEAVQTLFGVSYGLRFLLKRELGIDRKVGPLEGLWDVDGGDFSFRHRSNWVWTVLIEQSDAVTPAMVATVAERKGVPAPRLERLHEGRVAQILHVGPFAEEPATIERLHAFIAERDLRPAGRHHEMYLNDVRRTAPERLRTILRQPVTG